MNQSNKNMKTYNQLIDDAVALTIITQAEVIPFGKRKEVEKILKLINNHIEYGVWSKINALYNPKNDEVIDEVNAKEESLKLLGESVEIGEIIPVFIDPNTVRDSVVDISRIIVWHRQFLLSAEKALDIAEAQGYITFEQYGDKQ